MGGILVDPRADGTRPLDSAPRSGEPRVGLGHRAWQCALQAVAGLGPRRPRRAYKLWQCALQAVAGLGLRRPRRAYKILEGVMSERELTYGEAVKEAIAEEMRRDSRVFLIGEDVAEAGHPFKTLLGLVQEFGTQRIVDTPISEPGYAGIGVGAAMTGMRPIVDVMFGDFITLTMDQMVNQAAKAHYMSGGKIKVPIVFRTTLGATRRSAAQHSQSLHAWVSHVPGLKVALPSGPYEAKGLMKTAIRDDSPVVIFEDKMMYRVKGPVPTDDYTIPFG